MPSVVINQPTPGTLVAGGQQINVGGRATGTGGAEPRVVDSVTIGIDGGDGVAAKLTSIPHQPVPDCPVRRVGDRAAGRGAAPDSRDGHRRHR